MCQTVDATSEIEYIFDTITAGLDASSPFARAAKDRGWYFDGNDSYIADDYVFFIHGSIDAYIRPIDISQDRVIYSRNKPDNAIFGTEDFLTLCLTYPSEYLQIKFKDTTGATTSQTSSTSIKHAGNWVWRYV